MSTRDDGDSPAPQGEGSRPSDATELSRQDDAAPDDESPATGHPALDAGDNTVTVGLRIFGVDFQVRCAESEVDDLRHVANDLDTRMRRLRDAGAVAAMERLAVMAALNIGHENVQLRRQAEHGQDTLAKVGARLDAALARGRHDE